MSRQLQLTDAQWKEYEEQGYLKLGKLLSDTELRGLQQRIDDIMLGKAKLNYDRMLMQEDSEDGQYGSAGPQSKGHKGSHTNYRKIEELEFDPLFLTYMQWPIFRDICARVYGDEAPITAMRAMFMNKPANRGTWLPWHQDIWTMFDKHPLLTVWTALDPATIQNGCVQIIPGSHKLGHINPNHNSGFLTEEHAKKHCPADKVVHLELEAGEVALLHNYLLHASDVNRSSQSRRAFSVCYMDAATVNNRGYTYNRIFGPGALDPRELETAAVA